LRDYVPYVFGIEWCKAESAKHEEERHPVIQWRTQGAVYMNAQPAQPDGSRASAPKRGVESILYVCSWPPQIIVAQLLHASLLGGIDLAKPSTSGGIGQDEPARGWQTGELTTSVHEAEKLSLDQIQAFDRTAYECEMLH